MDLYITTDDRKHRFVCNSIQPHQDVRPRGRRRYPDNQTLLSKRSKYGIVQAECVRFQRTSMLRSTYADLCGEMMYDMVARAYHPLTVARKTRKAMAQGAMAYGHVHGRWLAHRAWQYAQQRRLQA